MSNVSVERTPPQPEALDPAMNPDLPDDFTVNVKAAADTSTSRSLPLQSKLAHLLAVVMTGVIALFVSATLADGSSVVKLKPVKDLPRLTDAKLMEKGLDYRADELLGPTYGVGLHHDSSGYTWTAMGAEDTLQTFIDELGLLQVIAAVPAVIASDGLKHPVAFLSCHELQKAGLSAMGLGFVAEIVSAVMIIFHGLALVGLLSSTGLSAKLSKYFSVLIWLTLSAGFMIVIGLAHGIMEAEWTCDNPFVPSIILSHHFEWQYGIGFGYTGYIASLLVLLTQMLFTSTTDGSEPSPNSKEPSMGSAFLKLIGGFFTGMIILTVVVMSVLGGTNAFDNDYEVDESKNYCAKQKPYHAGPGDHYFKNVDCMKDGMVQVLEQSGANVTRGYKGGLDAGTWRTPITKTYDQTDLCPVNVHWHLGAEHLSVGQFDEEGKGPTDFSSSGSHSHDGDYSRRKLAGDERLGYRCHHYDETDEKFTKAYDWKYCVDMHVGETYEVHWPHSAAGACGSKWQYQTPFYDGVFCKDGIINILTPLNTFKKIGVQGQVFTIVNDEEHTNDNLFAGMIVDDSHGVDMAMYTGSTTGTSRDNEMCSRYAPITWQVDRTCHLISASSFDLMCKKMLEQADDMSGDLYAHGARELVSTHLVANNQQSRKA